MVRTVVRVIVTWKCVRAAMLFAVRCFMRQMEKSVPYIIVTGFGMVFIPVESAMAFDFKKEYKEFYMPKDKPEIISVPMMMSLRQ